MRRWVVRLGAIVAIACPGLLAIEAAVGWTVEPSYPLYAAMVTVFALVGWIVSERQPANVVGPLMITFALLTSLALPADPYITSPGSSLGKDLAALLASFIDAPLFAVLALALIRFPDGRRPSPRWRWADWLTVAVAVTAFIAIALRAEPFPLYPEHRSPIGIGGFPGDPAIDLAYIGMLVLLIGAAASLVIRWRRGGPIERDQVKWIVAAAFVAVLTEIVNVTTFDPANPNSLPGIAASLGITLVPVAMGVAILRYRLYEIDRLISRTLSYAVVTGILTAVFAGVILVTQTVLSPITAGQTIPVAASTLAVFAMFQPVLRRVRRAVDRRFDRARYDSEHTLAAFADQLRDEVDLANLSSSIEATVREAIAPRSLWIWLGASSRDSAGQTSS